jgi:hypothetical protein
MFFLQLNLFLYDKNISLVYKVVFELGIGFVSFGGEVTSYSRLATVASRKVCPAVSTAIDGGYFTRMADLLGLQPVFEARSRSFEIRLGKLFSETTAIYDVIKAAGGDDRAILLDNRKTHCPGYHFLSIDRHSQLASMLAKTTIQSIGCPIYNLFPDSKKLKSLIKGISFEEMQIAMDWHDVGKDFPRIRIDFKNQGRLAFSPHFFRRGDAQVFNFKSVSDVEFEVSDPKLNGLFCLSPDISCVSSVELGFSGHEKLSAEIATLFFQEDNLGLTADQIARIVTVIENHSPRIFKSIISRAVSEKKPFSYLCSDRVASDLRSFVDQYSDDLLTLKMIVGSFLFDSFSKVPLPPRDILDIRHICESQMCSEDFENLKGWLKTFVGSLDSDTAVSVSDTQQLIKYLKVYRQLPLVIHLVTMLSDLIERETQGKEVLADESCRCLVLN